MAYELKTSDGKTAAAFISSADPSKWLPGKFSTRDKFEIPQNLLSGKYGLYARLAHKGKIFRDFKFAAKEAEADGSIKLAELEL